MSIYSKQNQGEDEVMTVKKCEHEWEIFSMLKLQCVKCKVVMELEDVLFNEMKIDMQKGRTQAFQEVLDMIEEVDKRAGNNFNDLKHVIKEKMKNDSL